MNRIRAILITLLLLSLPGEALASRMALVIGNATYERDGALANPLRDAEAFAAFLKKSGFVVTLVEDASRAQMSSAIVKFSDALKADDTALFYYAGHGMQMDGENYLIGVEAKLQSAFDVPGEAIGLTALIDLLESRAALSMIFIDACRNNPLAENLARQATRGITRGLAPIKAEGDGTMVAFAATPGQEAFDGLGENSPFTAALIAHLGEPGLEVSTAFKRVIRDVREATLNKQSPQIVSSVASEFYFGGDAVPPPVEPIAIPVLVEPPGDSEPEPIVVATPSPLPATTVQPVDAEALYKEANRLFDGDGVPVDKAAAIALFFKAADAGSGSAMNTLGVYYERGDGVPKSIEDAVGWFFKAAEAGNRTAMHNIGLKYFAGEGVPKDRTEAAVWYRRGADDGDATSMVYLGRAYALGLGVAKDDSVACDWAEKANALGNIHAAWDLSICLVYGRGMPQDTDRAAALAYRALTMGQSSSLDGLVKAEGYAMARAFRQELQRLLVEGGWYDGPIDGSFGGKTKAAIEAAFGSAKDG